MYIYIYIYIYILCIYYIPPLHQGLFLVMNKGQIGGSTAEGVVGASWALSFLFCRILTLPWLLYMYYRYCIYIDASSYISG